jgi:hypothetical protein
MEVVWEKVWQLGAFANRADVLRKMVERLERRRGQLRFCYEAGPCGYGLHPSRRSVLIRSPALIRINDGATTDRRDQARSGTDPGPTPRDGEARQHLGGFLLRTPEDLFRRSDLDASLSTLADDGAL